MQCPSDTRISRTHAGNYQNYFNNVSYSWAGNNYFPPVKIMVVNHSACEQNYFYVADSHYESVFLDLEQNITNSCNTNVF